MSARRTGWLAAAVAAVVVASGLSAPPAISTGAPAAAALAPGAIVRRWSPTFMTKKNSFTTDEAVTTAQRFDLVVTHPFALTTAQLDAMHAANPQVKVLAYVNATYTKVTTYPEAYYAHDLLGSRITWIPFGTQLLEMSNPATRATIGGIAQSTLTKPFDGVLLDSLGLTSLNPEDKTGYPIVPLGGAQLLPPSIPLTPYTGAAWLSMTARLIADVQTLLPSSFVMGNGLARGGPYFDLLAPTSVLSDEADSMESEQFVRSATDAVSAYRLEQNWILDVNMITDSEARGAPVTAVTKLWVSASAAKKTAWKRYALATFLLGTNGTSWFSFLGDKLLNTSVAASAEEGAPVGVPTGSYAKVGGVYQRTFTTGLVLVNPTPASVTVPLSRSYTNLDGATVSTSIIMPANTGQILTF